MTRASHAPAVLVVADVAQRNALGSHPVTDEIQRGACTAKKCHSPGIVATLIWLACTGPRATYVEHVIYILQYYRLN